MQHTVLVAHPSSELYGSDRAVLESVEAMVEDGWHVVVSLAVEGPLVGILQAVGAEVVVLPIPIVRRSVMTVRGSVGFLADLARSAPRMMSLIREVRPDVVYVNTITVPHWLIVARLAGRRAVCHVHEAEEAAPRLVRLALVAPLLLAHRVVANSRRSREVVVQDLPMLRRRVEVVYNGVAGPPKAVAPMREELIRPIRLVLVGRISPRKGTDVAVAALAELVARGHDIELDLVGDVFAGYEWFAAQVRSEALSAKVADRVHWLGMLPTVWGALETSDIALVPSRLEPFGNVAVEAMLAGRPVIAAAAQGLREIVRDGENGHLFPPGDAVALADTVDKVLVDWSAARARAESARHEARRRFAPARYRTDILGVLRDVMKGPTTARKPRGSGVTPPGDPAGPRVAPLVGRRADRG